MVLRLYRYNRIINIIIILFIIIFTINYSLFFKANIKIPMINPKKTIPYNGFLMKSIKRSLILSPVKYAVSFNNSKNNIGILKIIFIIFFVLSQSPCRANQNIGDTHNLHVAPIKHCRYTQP